MTCDGTVTGFALANPKLAGEREQARTMLERQPANRPAPGTAIVTDKGLSGEDTEAFFASPGLGLALIRPARKDEKQPRYFPNWLRQRVEAIIWTLKNQLGLERHGGRVPTGLWARIVQRLLALNAASRVAGGNFTPRLPQNPYVKISLHTALVTLITRSWRLKSSTASARTDGGSAQPRPPGSGVPSSARPAVCTSCGSTAPGRR